MKFTFTPHIKTIGFFNPDRQYTADEIKNETMFFGCSLEFIRSHYFTSPITNEILSQIEQNSEFQRVNTTNRLLRPNLTWKVDTRVNNLMPGFYPSIPGFHGDSLERGASGQPMLDKADENVQHFMVLVSDTKKPKECISGTEFITNIREYEIDESRVWQSLDEAARNDTEAKTRFVAEREIVQFNQLAIHRASPAKVGGWRLFLRLSLDHRPVKDEIRNHVQSYVDISKAGW